MNKDLFIKLHTTKMGINRIITLNDTSYTIITDKKYK